MTCPTTSSSPPSGWRSSNRSVPGTPSGTPRVSTSWRRRSSRPADSSHPPSWPSSVVRPWSPTARSTSWSWSRSSPPLSSTSARRGPITPWSSSPARTTTPGTTCSPTRSRPPPPSPAPSGTSRRRPSSTPSARTGSGRPPCPGSPWSAARGPSRWNARRTTRTSTTPTTRTTPTPCADSPGCCPSFRRTRTRPGRWARSSRPPCSKVAGLGPRNPKVANAGVNALSRVDSEAALAELARLATRVTYKSTSKLLDGALEARATALGLSREEIEELAVPAYGLTEVGRALHRFGDATALHRGPWLQVRAQLAQRGRQGRSRACPPR